jgi:hypothetical protein
MEDALGGVIEINEMPMSPCRLFELLAEASGQGAGGGGRRELAGENA